MAPFTLSIAAAALATAADGLVFPFVSPDRAPLGSCFRVCSHTSLRLLRALSLSKNRGGSPPNPLNASRARSSPERSGESRSVVVMADGEGEWCGS